MQITQHLDKDNLHHAYLIEGNKEEVVPEILEFINSLGVKTVANADFSHIKLDSFKIDDARDLKALASERGMSGGKRVFLISANSFLLEAQNTLLKIFEEPIPDTIFFLTVPDASALLKTFVSRFYFISHISDTNEEAKAAEKFISMPMAARIEFIKELAVEVEDKDEEGNEVAALDSTRSKSLRFLNALESVLQSKFAKNLPVPLFEHIFKVRKFLRMPGSSAKTLMESVALSLPKF